MANEKPRTTLGRDVLLAGVGAFLGLLGSIAFYHYTNTSPELVYEVSPPSLFTKDAKHTGIYKVRLENAGNKEVQEVQAYFELPPGCIILGITVEPEPKSVASNLQEGLSPNCKQVNLPLMNPGDSSKFTILAESPTVPELCVQIRGKGISGHPAPATEREWFASLAGVTSIISVVIMIIVGVTSAMTLIKSRRMSERLSGISGKILRLANRLNGKNTHQHLEELLLGRKYRLFFNPVVPGLSKTKIMRFGAGGRIIEGQNKNETSWRIKDDLLEFFNSEGKVYSRFYYDQLEDRFDNTNDTDTFSIRDQYIRPET